MAWRLEQDWAEGLAGTGTFRRVVLTTCPGCLFIEYEIAGGSSDVCTFWFLLMGLRCGMWVQGIPVVGEIGEELEHVKPATQRERRCDMKVMRECSVS